VAPVITRLRLTNFKCFRNVDLSLGELNVFAGANGAGKSTVNQALLLLYQSEQSGALAKLSLQLNGSLVSLGTGRDALFERSESDSFSIEVEEGDARWEGWAEVPSGVPGYALNMKVRPFEPTPSYLRRSLTYLSADRVGPQKSYSMDFEEGETQIGVRGEYAPLVLSVSRENSVANDKLLLENSQKEVFSDLQSQFTEWMRRLFPGFNLNLESNPRLDAITLGLRLQSHTGSPQFMRPANVGFGVSIVFPIVLAGIASRPGTTLIVENPEAHLHPSAQSSIGEFLARVASGGVQVFVETHSEHVLNGMRLAVKNEVMQPKSVKLFAFSRGTDPGSNAVSTVGIDEDGELRNAPESFFDQANKDLRLIYGI
jgi:predicted ATPase